MVGGRISSGLLKAVVSPSGRIPRNHNQMANDPTQDKDFLAASPKDQHAYLMATDPEYAKASPQDQQGYLIHVRNAQPTAFERNQQNNRGFFGTLVDKAKGLLSPSSTPPTAEEIRKGPGGPSLPREMLRQATRPIPNLPGQESGLDRAIYRTATTLSPLVPGLNPEASEAASSRGDTGAVAAEAAIPAALTVAGYGATAGARSLLRRSE